MKKSRIAAIASAVIAALVCVSATRAATYEYSFTSYDGQLTATGVLIVNESNQVTDIVGTITGLVDQTVSGIAGNPNFPSMATSSDGAFYYNDLYTNASPYLDLYGLLFTTVQNPGGYWNLWFDSGSYSLWESVASHGYVVQEMGALRVAAVPELSTWAMMGLGFAGLALASHRRSSRSDALSLG